MREELSHAFEPEIDVKDTILAFWKFLVFELMFKYLRLWQEYENALYSRDEAKTDTLFPELYELKQQIISLAYSIIAGLLPYIYAIYYNKKRMEELPLSLREFIRWVAENKNLAEEFARIGEDIDLNPSKLHELVSNIALLLNYLGIIETREKITGLR